MTANGARGGRVVGMDDALAVAAVAPIGTGMIVGLGTGRAASRAVRALAQRVRDEGLDVDCVSTSVASAELGRSLGLKIRPFADVQRVDYLFDGADEVDRELRMLKGKGGAMTREKMVARASDRRVYLVDDSKLVGRLGEKSRLPVEVLPFGLASVRRAIEHLGLKGPVRTTETGLPYETDNGCCVIDALLTVDAHVGALAQELNGVPGVIGHGLFLTEAQEVIVERRDGTIEKRVRGR